jgi:hypothetical protein
VGSRIFFSGWGLWCFAGVFCEKWVFDRGFLVVSTWWLGGETWCFSSQFFGFERCAMVSEFIFWGSRFGNAETALRPFAAVLPL